MNTQLILHDHESSDRSAIVTALQDVKVGLLSLEEFADPLSATLERGLFYVGSNKSIADRNLLKAMVLEDCQKYFRHMTRREIISAIENGYRGIYGEVKGIAPRDVYNWIVAYKNTALRLDVKKELESVDDFKTPPTEEEERLLAMHNLNNAWIEFKERGEFYDYGNVIYNLLSINNKISFSEEDRNRFKEVAKAKLLSFHAPEKHLGNQVKMQEAIHLFNDIKNDNEPARIRAEAKRLALIEFFIALKKEGKEIWDLFS